MELTLPCRKGKGCSRFFSMVWELSPFSPTSLIKTWLKDAGSARSEVNTFTWYFDIFTLKMIKEKKKNSKSNRCQNLSVIQK